jgi:hypothetical protein
MNDNITMGLLGKLYKDKILYLNDLSLGETNEVVGIDVKLGGAFNILNSNLLGISARCFCSGIREATILSESQSSRRTSILSSPRNDEEANQDVYEEPMDWLHIIYIDDYYDVDMPRVKAPISIDFCTNKKREEYIEAIEQCELVFDSRERKHLYSKIITPTPIVLHDECGCECIQMGEVVFNSTTKPVSGLNVNGAGDIFAAIFIREFMSSGLGYAVETTSPLVTKILKSRS